MKYTYEYMYIYMFTYIYTHTYARIQICICVNIHAYTHTHTHIGAERQAARGSSKTSSPRHTAAITAYAHCRKWGRGRGGRAIGMGCG